MISPSYGLTASERVLPRLALDWTTGLAQPGVNVARASVATFVNSSGVIELATANTQRIDWATGISALLVEEARTNLLLNSLINGTNLSTQSVTVTAAAHTLSFYGTGTVALTGTATATVNGSGEYPTRTTLTFTPAAGSLTLTVTGTVQFANLELGAFATSFIPTAGATVLRAADVATMTGTNFSDWFNAIEGTFEVDVIRVVQSVTGSSWVLDAYTDSQNRIEVIDSGASIRNRIVIANVATQIGSFVGGTGGKYVAAYKANNHAGSFNAATPATNAVVGVPSGVDKLAIGYPGYSASAFFNGYIQRIKYWPQCLVNAEVQAFSK